MPVSTLTINGAAPPAEASGASGTHDPFELFTIGEMTTRVAEIAVEKASHPLSFLVRSLVGGAMVSFGVLLSLVVSTGVSSPGIASLLMGLAFGMSFALILVSGMSLITADIAAGAIAILQRRMTVLGYLRLLLIGLVGNCIGALTFVAVCAAAGGPYLGAFAQRAAAVASAKTSQPALTAVLLAVVCTWFLQTSMCLFFKARTDIARMGFAFYGPFAFVIGATQHVIANIGFLGLPLLLSAFHPDAPHTQLTWGLGAHGLLTNIAITTAGNLVGGIVFVALPFHLVTRLQQNGR
ncbi:MAG: nitrite transporter [Mycobacterium sp.]|nr:nitrite transporter [Mycobacterium sp.]